MSGHGIQIEMLIDPNHLERAVNPENISLRHIALKVDDIEKTLEELGIEVGPIMNDWIGERFCYVADPDGLPVELHE
jgi:glyoxylase I family protein